MQRGILGALALAFVMIGCSTAPEKGGEASGSSEGKTKLVFIPKSSGNPYFNQVAKGFEEASGIEFQTSAPTSADATSQLAVIKDQVQRGAHVLVISANSPDALNEELDQARAKGVAIITVDSDLTGNESYRDLAILPTDFSKIGPAQLELLSEQIGYEGDFAILSATADAPNQNAWIAGMREALKDPKYAKMNLVEVVYGDDDAQKSTTEMEALLSKHSNLRGVISPTSVGLAAAAQVLENVGVYPGGPKATGAGVVLTGLSTPKQMRKAVEKGVVAKFQLWNPADMGKIAAYVGTQLRDGKKFAPGDKIEVPGHGTLEVGEKGVVFAGPLLTFDRSNIAEFDF